MSSQSASGSSAAPHTNPFLDQSSNTFVSSVPLEAPTYQDSTDPSTTNLPSSSSSSTSTGRTEADAKVDHAKTQANQAAGDVQAKANQVTRDARDALASLTDGQTKPGLAGNLAPEKETVAIPAPEGTEHVTNILSGIAGALASAPAAALEAVSPTAASKVSDGAAYLHRKMPSLSLQDATNAVSNAAGTVYSKVPEGTAATLQNYVGAAQHKAQEVLPPALGGSKVAGNTGSGDLAKDPNQLASEYSSVAGEKLNNAAAQTSTTVNNAAAQTGNALSNAAAQGIAYVKAAVGIASEKAQEGAAVAQQTAKDASATAQQKGAELSQAAQQTAQNASATVQQTAQDASAQAQRTAQDASNKASETASNVQASAQQTASDLSRKADEASRQASATANDAANRASSTANDAANRAADATDRNTPSSYNNNNNTSSSFSSQRSAGDLLNSTADYNTSSVHSSVTGVNPALPGAPEPQVEIVQPVYAGQPVVASNNPYSGVIARPHGEDTLAAQQPSVDAYLAEQQRLNRM